jgi:2-iminobutanoate/2-iminopropanoate deaminase
MREALSPPGAAPAIGPYSPALRVGQMVFLSGSIPLDPATGQMLTGDITEQATRVLENIGALLQAAGADYVHVVRTTVFLTDMNEFAAMNAV